MAPPRKTEHFKMLKRFADHHHIHEYHWTASVIFTVAATGMHFHPGVVTLCGQSTWRRHSSEANFSPPQTPSSSPPSKHCLHHPIFATTSLVQIQHVRNASLMRHSPWQWNKNKSLWWNVIQIQETEFVLQNCSLSLACPLN